MAKITINDVEYDSYVTLEEADKYLSVKLGSNWLTYDEETKKKLLVNATREIDKRDYQGKKADKDQPLKFPRILSCCCQKTTDENLIKQAVFELADALGSNSSSSSSGVISNLQAIKSMKVGDTDIEFKDDVTLEDPSKIADSVIDDLLGEYLKGNAEIWL